MIYDMTTICTNTTGFVLSNPAIALSLIIALHYEIIPELKTPTDTLQSNWQTASSSLLSSQSL
jgi:hypothetical protein